MSADCVSNRRPHAEEQPSAPPAVAGALISGGQPTHEAPGGCRTGSGINDSGLWIFLRSKVRHERTIAMVRQLAAAQGYDLSVLGNVMQDGCLYKPA